MSVTEPTHRPWWDRRTPSDAPSGQYVSPGMSDVWEHAWAHGYNAAIEAHNAEQAAAAARDNGPRTIQVEGQLSLLGGPPAPPAAEQVTSAAIAAAEQHADTRWKAAAAQVVADLAATGREFTADDVWARLTVEYRAAATGEPRALGAVIQAASRAGIIRATGEYRNSARAATHKSPKRVWIGA